MSDELSPYEEEIELLPDEELPQITRREAEVEAPKLFFDDGQRLRWRLYSLFRHKAHKACLMKSFTTYCKQVLLFDTDKTTISRAIRWARVERTLFGEKLTDGSTFSLKATSGISRDVALALAKLPTAADQRAAWEEYQQVQNSDKALPAQKANSFKHIVASRLSILPKDPTDVPPLPDTEPAPTTIVDPFAPARPAQSDQYQVEHDNFNKWASAGVAATEAARKHAEETGTEFVQGSTISTFTPPADDPGYEEPVTIDGEGVKLDLLTLMAWIDNDEIDGPDKIQLGVIASLCEASQWVEYKRRVR